MTTSLTTSTPTVPVTRWGANLVSEERREPWFAVWRVQRHQMEALVPLKSVVN